MYGHYRVPSSEIRDGHHGNDVGTLRRDKTDRQINR